MGNWFGRYKGVHPHEVEDHPREDQEHPRTSTILKVKVRMTTTQLKALVPQADATKGDSELGRLILRHGLQEGGITIAECWKTKCSPRQSSSALTLSTIFEEENGGLQVKLYY